MGCCGGASDLKLDEKLEILQRCTPFGAYFELRDLEELAGAFATCRMVEGEDLPESPFYIICKGSCAVVAKESSEQICLKSEGAFFSRRAGLVPTADTTRRASKRTSMVLGERRLSLSLLGWGRSSAGTMPSGAYHQDPQALRDATTRITTKQPGSALVIPPKNLNTIFAANREHQEILFWLMSASLEVRLAEAPFIRAANLSANELRALGELCNYQAVQPDSFVFRQGDQSEHFYIILNGDVQVTIDLDAIAAAPASDDRPSSAASTAKESPRARGVVSGPKRQGESFGVAALVYGGVRRKYSVSASAKTLLLTISKDNFSKFLEIKPVLKDSLMNITKKFLLQRYSAMSVPVFEQISEEIVDKAASLSAIVHFDKGDVIYRQGDLPKAFYVLLDGQVSMETMSLGSESDYQNADEFERSVILSSKDLGKTTTLGPGRYFGEVGVLLPNTPCIATTTSQTRTSLLKFDADAFSELFGSNRNLLAEMLIKLLRTGCPLKVALEHGRCRSLFTEFMATEYATESLLFYDEVVPLLPSALEAGAVVDMEVVKRILAEYVVDGSPQQVNLPHAIQKKLISCTAVPIEQVAALFATARREIYELMARDNFGRFVRSQPYEDLLDAVGTYNSSAKDLVADVDLEAVEQVVVQVKRPSSSQDQRSALSSTTIGKGGL